MKFLEAEEFFGSSINTVKTGMTIEAEYQRKQECIAFLRKLNTDIAHGDTKCLCMAVYIFSLYARKVPFSKFDRYIAAGIAHYIAQKIFYYKPEIHTYEEYVHFNAPMLSSQQNSD